MKLKKIAALALAGIMAVSMLAACGEGAGSTNNTQTEVTANSTNIVSILNDTVKGNKAGVSFESNANFDKMFELAIGAEGVTAADVRIALGTNLDADPAYVQMDAATTLNPAVAADNDPVNTVEVYAYNVKDMTAQSAAYQAAVAVNTIVQALNNQAVYTTDKSIYDCDYSKAYASMKTVKVGDDTYYLVAVSLTCQYVKAE